MFLEWFSALARRTVEREANDWQADGTPFAQGSRRATISHFSLMFAL
jgi:hypothetical protein